MVRFAFITLIALSVLGSRTNAGDENTTPSSPVVDANTAKPQVLAWVDDYRVKQVLFHDEDIAKLRKELEDDTPEEAVKWWNNTAKVRAALESPQWQETREWLREFLRVQAIYSDEQLEQFAKEAKEAVRKESPQEFEDILAEVEAVRKKLYQGAANSEALRDRKLAVVDAYKKDQHLQRMAAKAMQKAAKRNAGREPVRPRHRQLEPRPLVDSLDIARRSVMHGLRRGW